MGARPPAEIRNFALVGHAAAGKTTLAEAMLHKAGVTNRFGSVDDGTSHLDYDEESKDRRHSVEASLAFLEHGGKLLNLIDTPGMPDYCGHAIAGVSAVETAVIVISAAGGIGANTRRMFNVARDLGLARFLVINRIDAENANLPELLAAVRETFGGAVRPFNLPADGHKSLIDLLTSGEGGSDVSSPAEARTALLDAIVETDDALMTEYMDTGTVASDKLLPAIAGAVASGAMIPLFFTNAKAELGVGEVMDALIRFAPSPERGQQRVLASGDGEKPVETPLPCRLDAPFAAQAFKITSDPRSSIRYSVARVISGSLAPDSAFHLGAEKKTQKAGHLYRIRGGQYVEVPAVGAGDIVAFAKVEMHIGTLLGAAALDGTVKLPKFPTPMFSLAVEPKNRTDADKVGAALHRFSEEDPCFKSQRDAQTGELVISGMGDLHLNVIRSKMKRQFKLEVDSHNPKIPYRETISGSVKYVEHTHKKQSGGAGQFARVFIDMEPNERGAGYEFIDKIFGGVIDLAFRPSVDKGVREVMKRGVIAGYPVVDVKVSLVDGKTHPVDSKDIAFQIAGRQVFKKAFVQCRPILLEPIVTIEVTCPTQFLGEITRDLAGKRGQILGQDMLPGDQTCVRATVPLAEVATYSSQLKSVTGGQGSYGMEFSHYDIVPPNVQQQIMASYKAHEDEDA